MKRFLAVVSFFVLVFTFVFCNRALRSEENKPEEAEKTGISGKVAPASIDKVLLKLKSFSGSFKIQKVAAQGASVSAGENLITLDDRDLAEALEDAKKDLEEAKNNLHEKELAADFGRANGDVTVARNKQTLEDARRELANYADVNGKIALENSELGVEQSKDSLEYQKEELAQLEKMYKESDLAVDTQEIVLNRSRRQIKYAEKYLEHSKAGHKQFVEQEHPKAVRDLKQKVDDAEREGKQHMENFALGTRVNQLAVERAKSALRKAEKAVADLESDLSTVRGIKAPSAGILLHGSLSAALDAGSPAGLAAFESGLKEGDSLQAGDQLFSIFKPNEYRIVIAIPEAQIGQWKKGSAVSATLEALPGKTFKGRVTEISFLPSVTSEGNVFMASLALDAQDADLKLGLTASVELTK